MKVKSIITKKAKDRGATLFIGLVALVVVAILVFGPTVADSGGPSKGPVKPSGAVKFEDIPGSKIKRVILTPKAAERLGIQTGKVSMKQIIRKQMAGGRVVPPVKDQPASNIPNRGFGSFGQIRPIKSMQESPATPAPDGRWVAVTLSRGEWNRLWKDKPARVLPLTIGDKPGKAVLALPSGLPPQVDLKRTMLKVYYKLQGMDHELYHRVRVELPLSGSDKQRLVVPYSAIYYDGKGDAWVYVNPEPLVYERQRVDLERVVGDFAVLKKGPAIGTEVVTTGAALLYGAEVIFKR
jgi:hypothetical protein